MVEAKHRLCKLRNERGEPVGPWVLLFPGLPFIYFNSFAEVMAYWRNLR